MSAEDLTEREQAAARLLGATDRTVAMLVAERDLALRRVDDLEAALAEQLKEPYHLRLGSVIDRGLEVLAARLHRFSPPGGVQDTPADEDDPGRHAKLRRALGSVLRPAVPLDRLGDTIDAVEQAAVAYFAAPAPEVSGTDTREALEREIARTLDLWSDDANREQMDARDMARAIVRRIAVLASSSSQDREAGGRVWSRWTRGILGPGEWMLVHDADELERRRSAPGWEVAEFVQAVSSQDTGERERRELLCQRCDREYAVWSAPNAVWNQVVRDHGGDGYGDDPLRDTFLCASCFAMLADARGIRLAPWVLAPESMLDQRSRDAFAANPYEPASSSPSGGEGGGHRLKISLDAGAVVSELICPESGCEPVDAEGPPAPCWLRTWAESEDLAANYVQETVPLGVFSIEAANDNGQPVVRIVAPSIGARIETPAPGGEGRDAPAREEWRVLGIDVSDDGDEAPPEILVEPIPDRWCAEEIARTARAEECPPYDRVVLQRRLRTVTEWVDVPAREDGGEAR